MDNPKPELPKPTSFASVPAPKVVPHEPAPLPWVYEDRLPRMGERYLEYSKGVWLADSTGKPLVQRTRFNTDDAIYKDRVFAFNP